MSPSVIEVRYERLDGWQDVLFLASECESCLGLMGVLILGLVSEKSYQHIHHTLSQRSNDEQLP